MPLTVRQAIATGVKTLSDCEATNPRLDVEILLAHALDKNREDLFTNFEQVLLEKQQDTFNRLIAKRVNNEPVARILGFKEFWSMDFKLNEATLIPRPDSETLVAAVLTYAKTINETSGLKILDLGTGSGCLLLAILSELSNATGWGVDAACGAVELAKDNALSHGLADRSVFTQYNWLTDEAANLASEKFDIIISNPPYIESSDIANLQTEVGGFDPKLALDGGVDGLLHYRALAKTVHKFIRPDGKLFLEIGCGQAMDVIKVFIENGWGYISTHKDLAGIERVLMFKNNQINTIF